MAMEAEGNALGLNGGSKISPVWAIQFFAAI
jgi:hypothetical protein